MTDEDIRQVSSILYGNAERLRAAAAIGRLSGKPVTATSVAREARMDYRRAQEQVAWFKQGRLLVLDQDPGSTEKRYRVVDISYWTAAAHLEAELQDRDDLL
jgi:hypothetical protein